MLDNNGVYTEVFSQELAEIINKGEIGFELSDFTTNSEQHKLLSIELPDNEITLEDIDNEEGHFYDTVSGYHAEYIHFGYKITENISTRFAVRKF
jgi:hypothetical protein